MMQQRKGFKKWKFVAFFAVVVGLLSAIAHLFGLSNIEEKQLAKTDKGTDSIAEAIIDKSDIDQNNDGEDSSLIAKTNIESDNEEEAKDNEESMSDEENAISDSCANDSESINLNADWFAQSKVWSYPECFPDSNAQQMAVAKKNGVPPMSKRDDVYVQINKNNLSSIMSSPYYVVDDLTHSMPYLVPKAQLLLNTIGINFVDSLASKGMELHLPIVTSVLRTNDDIKQLQRRNKNSVSNSCHCYGTTIDITYNRFSTLDHKGITSYDDHMKKVLAEVLYDLRMEGKCYVKYERKQACFHLTVR